MLVDSTFAVFDLRRGCKPTVFTQQLFRFDFGRRPTRYSETMKISLDPAYDKARKDGLKVVSQVDRLMKEAAALNGVDGVDIAIQNPDKVMIRYQKLGRSYYSCDLELDPQTREPKKFEAHTWNTYNTYEFLKERPLLGCQSGYRYEHDDGKRLQSVHLIPEEQMMEYQFAPTKAWNPDAK